MSEIITPALETQVDEAPFGGHAIVAAGYDDILIIGNDRGPLPIRNLWGVTWAPAGYGWISCKYVTHELAEDW